jgi:hypothetical protein
MHHLLQGLSFGECQKQRKRHEKESSRSASGIPNNYSLDGARSVETRERVDLAAVPF